jgi:hypothetical protein
MGLLQTYQTGQTLAPLGGSDGLPLGPFADWAALPASGEDGALASVTSLGPGNAYGIAVYDDGASEWALHMAWFDTVADMEAFAQPISTGALAAVEASASNDENGVRYQYDGAAWARTAALTAGFVWALTVTQAITGADPSGVGAVKDGDYGIIAGSGGPVVLRYKASCTLGYGGTRAAWMSPLAYAGTPVLQAYTDGTESNATLAAQGWTISTDAGCSVVATGGFQRLSATSPTPAQASLRTMVGAVTSSTRIECLCEARASTAAGTFMWALCLQDGANGTFVGQEAATGFGFMNISGTPLNTPLRNGTNQSLPTLAQTPAILLLRDEGRTVQSVANRDGVLVGDYRRNLANAAGNVAMAYQYSTSNGTGTTDFRGQYITY